MTTRKTPKAKPKARPAAAAAAETPTAPTAATNADFPTATTQATQATQATHSGFPIVGIGASAGGLAAFEAFFSGMPPTPTPAWPLCWCSTWRLTIRAF